MCFRPALLCALSFGVLTAADTGLTHVRHVYLLPMGSGLDQYLANELTGSGRYQVVADPKAADALLTDQLGAEFESRLDELYPPPEPVPPPEEEKQKQEEDSGRRSVGSMMSDAPASPRRSSFSRGRGNVFLVDRESRRVIWSTYFRPRTTRPDDLHRAAGEIVDRLDSAARREIKDLHRIENSAAKAVPAPQPPPPVPVAPPRPASTPAPAQPPAAPVQPPPAATQPQQPVPPPAPAPAK